MKHCVGLALVCMAAACGEPQVETFGYDVSTSSISFDHAVGDTDCPQDLGDVEVENFSDTEPFFFTVSVDDVGGEDLIDFGDADDLSPTSLDEVEFEVEPLGSVIFVPWFNCGQPTSFTTTIVVTPEDLTVDEVTIAVNATIQ